jgi:hypothetical protein
VQVPPSELLLPKLIRLGHPPQHTKELIQQTFGRIPRSLNQPAPAAAALDAGILVDAVATPVSSNGSSDSNGATAANGAAASAADASSSSISSSSGSSNGAAVGRDDPTSGAILDSQQRPRGFNSGTGLVG